MKITKKKLRRWKSYKEECAWFVANFPSGEAEYQDVLNKLAEEDKFGYAFWLMNRAGEDKGAVLELESFSGKHLFVAGSLVVKGDIKVEGYLLVAGNIEAGGDIRSDLSICAGGHIHAGRNIDYGWYISS